MLTIKLIVKNIMTNPIKNFKEQISNFTYWKKEVSEIILISILIKWSILIEDLPWVWKTTLSKAISRLIWYDYNRIQWTSDILPQDILGGEIFNLETKKIEIKKGPIFTQLLLVDEINRMNPKTQSAFLQAMEEKNISISGKNYKLFENFFVIATQNPIEYSWTFPLPEAQKDRFFSKISLWKPDDKTQIEILINNWNENITNKLNSLEQVIDLEYINNSYKEIQKVKISEDIAKKLVYFFNLIWDSKDIIYPISQRWIAIFTLACKANAFLNWRDYIIPNDGYSLIKYFLIHRLDLQNENEDSLNELYKIAFKNF